MSQSALKRLMSAEKIPSTHRADTADVPRISDYDLGKVIDNNRTGNIIFSDTIIGDINEYMDNRVDYIVDAVKNESSTFALRPGEDIFDLIKKIMARVDKIIAYEAVGGLRSAVEKEIARILISALSSHRPGEKKNEYREFDLSKLEAVTTFWADREKKTRGGRSAIEFLIAVYGEYGLGRGLTKAHIRQHDPKLYMALSNWARDEEKKEELDKLLPSGREKYLADKFTDEELLTYRKVAALNMRKLRA